MSLPDEPARRAAWSAYWATGGLHSCVGSFAGNYDGAIGAFWREVAQSLPARPVRALDLATGNGAIPRLLLEACREDTALAIDAVDLAALSPGWVGEEAVRFHPGVRMEALPFADASFDLVCSQFGFEYARRDAALAEALRVLRPDGRLALVMHHAGSVLVSVARGELAHQARLLAPGGLLDRAAAVMPWFALARRGGDPGRHAEAVSARLAYNTEASALAEAIATSPAPDLLLEARDAVARLLASTGPDPAPAQKALAEYRQALEAARLRTRELVDCALDDAAVESLRDALRRARPGAALACEPLVQAEGLLGWGLRLPPA